MASIPSGWTLYYSNEGYPYYYNDKTNESVWADTTSNPEPTFPQVGLPARTEGELPRAEVSESDDSSEVDDEDDDDDEDEDDDETEKQFLEYIQSSDGIAAMEVSGALC